MFYSHTVLLIDLIKDYFPLNIKRQPSKNSYKKNYTSAILIPTYCPTKTTYKLIKSIKRWNPEARIIIIDDKTPLSKKNIPVLNRIKQFAKDNKNIKYIRTKNNSHKAGALNYGINKLLTTKNTPQIIFTLDDDVIVNKDTFNLMKKSLYSGRKIAAVCSFVRVINKNVNLLTRLQGLEYHSFNLTKIADNTFLNGPLVMQGMLTGFRTSALKKVHGFTIGHLIEDYDITARLKGKGFKVKIEDRAQAWTEVPESIGNLWKQRIRWTLGGLEVVKGSFNNIRVVFQDFLGHSIFISLFMLILLSLFIYNSGENSSQIERKTFFIIIFSLYFISSIYNIILLTSYKDGEWKDWILKLSIIPELFYSNLLTINLIGSYLFFIFRNVSEILIKRFRNLLTIYNYGSNIFLKLGYSSDWGTKEISKKGGITI